jgi:hypothetical protein
MAKKKQEAHPPEVIQPEIIQATPLNQNEQEAFDKFDELFHVHEDNYNAEQDTPLLSLIMNANFTNDKVKIKYLFKKYRDEARDNHGV